MKFKFSEKEMKYDGTQLRSLFNYLEFDMQGDSILAFIGPCSVSLDHMVDGEDKKQNATIASDQMLHFIIEIFHQSLFSAVALQRIMADLAIQKIQELSSQRLDLSRNGDDIYLKEKKLSISIATASPVSHLIHFALNTTTKGTPVPTSSLEELGIDAKALAEKLGPAFKAEFEDIFQSTTKIHWVK